MRQIIADASAKYTKIEVPVTLSTPINATKDLDLFEDNPEYADFIAMIERQNIELQEQEEQIWSF